MPLKLVPKRDAEPAEAVRTRIKRMAKPDGMLQCPHCGGRATCRIEHGVVIANGKRQRGTVTDKDICATCLEFRRIKVLMRTGHERPEVIK